MGLAIGRYFYDIKNNFCSFMTVTGYLELVQVTIEKEMKSVNTENLFEGSFLQTKLRNRVVIIEAGGVKWISTLNMGVFCMKALEEREKLAIQESDHENFVLVFE